MNKYIDEDEIIQLSQAIAYFQTKSGSMCMS